MGEDDTRLAHIIESKEKYLEKKYPTFYYTSQDKTIFTDANFLSWMLQGIIHGFIIFFVTYLCFDSITFSNAGLSTDLWNLSLISFTTIIFVIMSSFLSFQNAFFVSQNPNRSIIFFTNDMTYSIDRELENRNFHSILDMADVRGVWSNEFHAILRIPPRE